MNLILLIATLNISVIFSETPAIDCGYPGTRVNACYSNNRIILDYQNPTETLYHELGHRLFLEDQEVKDLISKYPAPRKYDPKVYTTDEMRLNERVADYFAMYSIYPDFPDKFPEVKELFDRKISELLK